MALIDPYDPEEIKKFVTAEALRQGVNPSDALAIFNQESRFNVNAKSPKGALGVAQLMPATAAELNVDPNKPLENIRGGITYYKQQLERFKDPTLAKAAYNAGPGAVQKYGGVPPFAETQDYVRKTATEDQSSPIAPSAPVRTLVDPWDTQVPAVQPSTALPERTLSEQAQHELGRFVRMGLTGAGSTVGLFADIPYMLAHSLGYAKNLELPSVRFQQGLTKLGLPEDETTTEKVTGLLGTMAAGATLDPIASIIQAKYAPTTLTKESPTLTQSQQAIKTGMAKGYTVTPGQAQAGAGSRALESLSSSSTTEAIAKHRNQFITNALAKEELGLPQQVELNEDVLKNLAKQTFQDTYEPLQKFGLMTTGRTYRLALNKLVADYQSTNFTAATKKEVLKLVKGYRKSQFDSKFITRDIQQLREDATDAFKRGDSAIGKTNEGLARALEGAIEQNLQYRALQDPTAKDILNNFRIGRQKLAKINDVKDALTLGDVDIKKLVSKLDADVPLSGNLRLMAEFGKAAKSNVASPGIKAPPPITPWDATLGAIGFGGGTMFGLSPYLGLAAGRGLIRQGLLTKPYQRTFIMPKESLFAANTQQAFVPRLIPGFEQGFSNIMDSPFASE